MKAVLRKWRTNDINSLCKYANNRKIALNLRDAFPYPYTREDGEYYIKSCIEAPEDKQYCLALDINGEAVGSIGVFFKDDVYKLTAEIGYWLAEPYWGQGIMTEAVREVCGYIFKHYDVIRIYAEIFGFNKASGRVLEKSGFKLEGILRKSVYKNGEIYDGHLYSILKEEILD